MTAETLRNRIARALTENLGRTIAPDSPEVDQMLRKMRLGQQLTRAGLKDLSRLPDLTGAGSR